MPSRLTLINLMYNTTNATKFFISADVNTIKDPSSYERKFKFPASSGDFISTGNTSHDQFTSELDGDPVVLTFNNFTINDGHTVTTSLRCKGLYLNILGDLIVNGTLSMTARGANAPGKYVAVWPDANTIYFNSENTFSDVAPTISTLIHPVGGEATANGINGACGGGGNGDIRSANNVNPTRKQGSAGTSFSGGSGGGGAVGSNAATAGSPDGGEGGTGAVVWINSYIGAGGGAGNPGGQGHRKHDNGLTRPSSFAGESGTGGLLSLLVRGNIIISDTGSIQSNGSRGGTVTNSGHGSASGGGSGGGAIHIFHKGEITNTDGITANGGAYGSASNLGTYGGKGTINIVKW